MIIRREIGERIGRSGGRDFLCVVHQQVAVDESPGVLHICSGKRICGILGILYEIWIFVISVFYELSHVLSRAVMPLCIETCAVDKL